MNKKLTFRHMDHSAVIEEYFYKHLSKIERFLEASAREPIFIEMLVEAHPVHAHNKVEIRLHAPNYHFIAYTEDPDIYKAIDQTIHKVHNDLTKAKEKLVDHNKAQCTADCLPNRRNKEIFEGIVDDETIE
jgi:ribosomal subunit interface protein